MNGLPDEDRADTARMLGGCGKLALVIMLVIAAVAAWKLLS